VGVFKIVGVKKSAKEIFMKKIVLILVILFSISISAGNLYAQASSHQIVGRWEYQSGF